MGISNDTTWKYLETAQNEALHIATSCHKMSHHLHVETKLLPVKYHSELAKQYWLSWFQSICVIISPLCLSQLETWSSTARLCHSLMKVSQMSTHTIPVHVLPQSSSHRSQIRFCTKQSPWSSWVLKVCYLSQSIPHLRSCILVTFGSWTLTKPASPAAYQMIILNVEWHHTPVEHLFNCQSHPTQLTVQNLWDNPLQLQTSSAWTTDDARWAAGGAGLSQQQQRIVID